MNANQMLKCFIFLTLSFGASLAMAGGNGGRFSPADAWWQSNSRWSQIHGDSANYPGYGRYGRYGNSYDSPANWGSQYKWPIGDNRGPTRPRDPYWNM